MSDDHSRLGSQIKGVQRLLREHGVERVKSTGSDCATDGIRSPASRRPTSLAEGEPMQLSALEVEALRAIMAELGACRDLLGAARGDKSEPHRERAG